MELKQATIGKFENKFIDEYNIQYIVDEKSIFYPYCIYDKANMRIIDINSGQKYRVLKRDEHGRIDSSEISKIKCLENYALYLKKINFDRMSQSEKRAFWLKYYKTLLGLKLSLNKEKGKKGKIFYLSEYKKNK